MREVRALDKSHIDAYTEVAYNAYPSFKDLSEEAVSKYKKIVAQIMDNDPQVKFFGLFDNEKLISVVRFFNFEMNCFGKVVPVGGVGFLGVHILHKKQRAAKALLEHFETFCMNENLLIGMLLPFRPDYYKGHGYGFGTKMNQYRVYTEQVPEYNEKCDLRFYDCSDLTELLQCHKRFVQKTHGMIMKFGDEIRNLANDINAKVVASYDESGQMNGYIAFRFFNGKPGNYTINEIYVDEIIYENPKALRILLGFIRKQQDQVRKVIFNTADDSFHYLFENPLNDTNNYVPFGNLETNTQCIGIMYKIFDTKKAFKDFAYRNFNNANLCVRFNIKNDITMETIEEVIVRFKNGFADTSKIDSAEDVIVSVSKSDFSSLFMGCVSVKELYCLARLQISEESLLDTLNLAFLYNPKPINNTDF